MAATATPARVRLEIDAMKWAASAARIDYKLTNSTASRPRSTTRPKGGSSVRGELIPEEFQERLRTIEDARR